MYLSISFCNLYKEGPSDSDSEIQEDKDKKEMEGVDCSVRTELTQPFLSRIWNRLGTLYPTLMAV